MLNKLLVVVIFGLFFLVVITFFHSSEKNTGYIPADQKPAYVWFETFPGSGSYDCNPKVMVITEKGDTIFATFNISGLGGSFALRYRDTYPPSIGKKLYVRMEKNDDVYYIISSSLESIEK